MGQRPEQIAARFSPPPPTRVEQEILHAYRNRAFLCRARLPVWRRLMFAIVEPWGPGWAVRDARDGTLVRRGFRSREEADAWSSATDRADLREFFYPSSVHWGEDYDERLGMKRVFARSAEEALEWAITRQGATLTIENIFPKDR